MNNDSFSLWGIDLNFGAGFDSIKEVKELWDAVPWGRRYRIRGRNYVVVSLLNKPFFQEEGGDNEG